MIFRNAQIFSIPTTIDLSAIDETLSECAVKPVGPLELSSQGFTPPMSTDDSRMTVAAGKIIVACVEMRTKVLPGSVVNELLQKKLAEIEEKEGRKPGGRSRKRIKDELIMELLPRAFVKSRKVYAAIDAARGVVFVDSPSRKVAESVISEFRRALGTFPAMPLNAEVSPRAVMTGFVAGDDLPDGLCLGYECEFRDPSGGGVVRTRGIELTPGDDEISSHLEAGKQVTKLSLIYNDRSQFLVSEDMSIKKFTLLDGAVDLATGDDVVSLEEEMMSIWTVACGELASVYDLIKGFFKISAQDA